MQQSNIEESGLRLFWKVVAWGIGMLLVLQVGRLPFADGHSVCGAWGCGPPLQALVAWHGFWAVLLAGPLTIGGRYLDRRTLTQAAFVVGGLGLLGVLGFVAWDCLVWYPSVSDYQQQFLLERCLFSVVTAVDVPVIALTLVGFGRGLWLLATRPSPDKIANVESEELRIPSHSI